MSSMAPHIPGPILPWALKGNFSPVPEMKKAKDLGTSEIRSCQNADHAAAD